MELHNHHHHDGHDHHHHQFSVPLQRQRQQQQGAFGGEATMQPTPGDGAFTAAFDNQDNLNKWIRSNLYIILTVIVIAVVAATRIYRWYLERSSASQVADISRNRTGDEAINDGIRQARERQMRAVQEAQKRDAELREQRRLEDLAEKERKLKERQQQQQQGNDDAPALGFTERLPTLPSGNNYRPSDTWNSGGSGGGGYRPTGFARPRRGG